jgi:hypothetical protein
VGTSPCYNVTNLIQGILLDGCNGVEDVHMLLVTGRAVMV